MRERREKKRVAEGQFMPSTESHGEMEGGGREKEKEGGERTPTVMERTAEHRRTDGERGINTEH